jgi:hypothetical protein
MMDFGCSIFRQLKLVREKLMRLSWCLPMEANDRISKKDWSQYFRLNRIKAPKYNSKQQASQVCLLSGNQRDIQVSI